MPKTALDGRYLSPLRYPGGKARMGPYLAATFDLQWGLMDYEIWFEPFAGGLGAGLHLLRNEVVSEVWFCEANPALAAMWRSLLRDTDAFAGRVERAQPSLALFDEARETIAAANAGEHVDDDTLGFAGFVVNRCSRSGIVTHNAGPVGGRAQTGKHTIGDRFHPDRLARRLRDTGPLLRNMRFYGEDGIAALRELDGSVGVEDEVVAFVDPPYVDVGNTLYAQGLSEAQHLDLAWALNTSPVRWALTYDSTAHIADEWYRNRRVIEYQIRHRANRQHVDTEYLILSDDLDVEPGSPIPGLGWQVVRDYEVEVAVEQFELPLPLATP